MNPDQPEPTVLRIGDLELTLGPATLADLNWMRYELRKRVAPDEATDDAALLAVFGGDVDAMILLLWGASRRAHPLLSPEDVQRAFVAGWNALPEGDRLTVASGWIDAAARVFFEALSPSLEFDLHAMGEAFDLTGHAPAEVAGWTLREFHDWLHALPIDSPARRSIEPDWYGALVGSAYPPGRSRGN